MPSAFISYAHEDQEFVLALAEALRDLRLDIRFDQVVLRIGDSLIRRLADEIANGDFLVAIVSPDSVRSEWCRTEIELAQTQGINERRVKVLPVRYRGAAMPPSLQTLYWGDADKLELATLARQLATAIRDHEQGREIDAVEHPEEPEGEDTDMARNPERDTRIAELDNVADKVFDVLGQWDACREGEPTVRLVDKQRRLQYALAILAEDAAAGLPLVARLSRVDWNDLNRLRPPEVEADVMEELRSARIQIAQDLRVVNRWVIVADHGPVPAGNRDARAHLWEIGRGDERKRVVVYISGTALASHDDGLPIEVVEAKRTNGRSVIVTLLGLDEPPQSVMVTTAGIRWPIED